MSVPRSTNPIYDILQKVGLLVLIPIISWAFVLSGDVKILQTKELTREQLDANRDKKQDIILERQEKILIQIERINTKLEDLESK
jgi:hypothetical protein